GVPCPAAMILLLPADGNPDLIRRDQSDSDGTFTLPDVLPGRYTLVAIDNGHDLAYQDRAVMEKYLAQGQTVEIPLKNTAQITVKVQPRLP
ncbi:MAG: carboxypeptidase-like regulatory domain-containing protein, partial [Bryobacteraceae bacterium]